VAPQTAPKPQAALGRLRGRFWTALRAHAQRNEKSSNGNSKPQQEQHAAAATTGRRKPHRAFRTQVGRWPPQDCVCVSGGWRSESKNLVR